MSDRDSRGVRVLASEEPEPSVCEVVLESPYGMTTEGCLLISAGEWLLDNGYPPLVALQIEREEEQVVLRLFVEV
jgi:hypothetical protein